MIGTDEIVIKHGTLDYADDDKANGLGSNSPADIFLI